ncbi:MAG: reprolysin-like metallopeptidase [Bacteroidota bacterium]
MRLIATLICFLFLSTNSFTQDFWEVQNEEKIELNANQVRAVVPEKYGIFLLEVEELQAYLSNSSLASVALYLPLPNGELELFQVKRTSNMHPKLAKKYNQIASYAGHRADDESDKIRFSLDPNGLHAIFSYEGEEVYIDPYAEKQKDYYISYFTKDYEVTPEIREQYAQNHEAQHAVEGERIGYEIDPTTFGGRNSPFEKNQATRDLRVYRFALACTGEYGQRHGGTVQGALAAMNVALDRINFVLEKDVAVRLELVANNDEVIFTDADTDPYTDPEVGPAANTNVDVLNSQIGIDNYDVGHVLTTVCAGGAAGVSIRPNTVLGTVCLSEFNGSSYKGRASSCEVSTTDRFYIGIICHELGHQFSAEHTWNNCPTVEDQNQFSFNTAYEPGGGVTIMSYGRACGTQSYGEEFYYHNNSIESILLYTREGTGSTCGTSIPTENNIPSIEIPLRNGFSIPISTPFELTAEANDIDGDVLTYSWEQYDLDFNTTDIGDPVGNEPTFRSQKPITSPTRTFPDIRTILNNRNDPVEVLPTYSRDLTFRCTVRDNNQQVGAVAWDEVAFKSDETAGPFIVTSFNGANTALEAGSYQEVTWDVANTDNTRVNCQRVNIKLSTDGGRTYPVTLLDQTANDGSAFVTLPNMVSSSARIKVEAADNIFFDITNRSFRIIEPSEPGFAVQISPFYQEVCLPNTVEVEVNTSALLDFDSTIVLGIENLPEGITTSLSSENIAAGEDATLTFMIEELGASALFTFDLVAKVDGVDTLIRPIEIDAVSNDFSALALTTPANNTKGIVGTTDFIWSALGNATTYDFELASSPAFGEDLIVSFEDLTTTMVRPDVFLEQNSLYYWRIRPKNQCGDGDFSIPNVFQTINVQCLEFAKEENLTIPRNGTPTVESVLTIEDEGVVTDLNLPSVSGGYQPVRFIEMSLISPAGTQVILFEDLCGSTRDFNLGFDDEAPDEITCPPTAGVTQQPVGTLADFDGESITGDWTMRFRVKQAGFGGGGSIGNWSMESCGDIPISAPFLVTNETFEIPPNERSQIWTETLEADDEDNRPAEISFQLVSIPENGTLYRNEVALQVGDSFTQQDIDGFLISYEHDGSETTNDRFDFVLLDTDGGWFGTVPFNIVIDETATVDTDDISLNDRIHVYPNPTAGELQIEFKNLSPKGMLLQLFDLNGRLLKELRNFAEDNVTMDMSSLADGIYLISVQSEQGRYMEKVVLQK